MKFNPFSLLLTVINSAGVGINGTSFGEKLCKSNFSAGTWVNGVMTIIAMIGLYYSIRLLMEGD